MLYGDNRGPEEAKVACEAVCEAAREAAREFGDTEEPPTRYWIVGMKWEVAEAGGVTLGGSLSRERPLVTVQPGLQWGTQSSENARTVG